MKFNEEELETLKDMLEEWVSEGFTDEITDVQRSILLKLGIE